MDDIQRTPLEREGSRDGECERAVAVRRVSGPREVRILNAYDLLGLRRFRGCTSGVLVEKLSL